MSTNFFTPKEEKNQGVWPGRLARAFDQDAVAWPIIKKEQHQERIHFVFGTSV